MRSGSESFEEEGASNIGGDASHNGNANRCEEPDSTYTAELFEELAAFLRASDAGLHDRGTNRLMEPGSGPEEIGVVSFEELTAAAEQIGEVLPVLFRYARNRPQDVQSFLKGLVNSFYIRVIKPEL